LGKIFVFLQDIILDIDEEREFNPPTSYFVLYFLHIYIYIYIYYYFHI